MNKANLCDSDIKQHVSPAHQPYSIRETLLAFLSISGVLFLLLPLVGLLWRGIANQGWESLPDSGVRSAIWLSYQTTLMSSITTVVLGTPLAFVLARRRFFLKSFINVLVELPIVLPPAVAGLALLVTFGSRGVLGGWLGNIGITLPFSTVAVVIAQTFVSMPFYIRAAVIGFEAVPRTLEEAAQVDGASGRAVFVWITLPLASRALLAGLMLSWARALGEFGATLLFAGSIQRRTQTMPLLIYNILERDIDAAIWTGIILVGIALVVLGMSRFLGQQPSVE